MKLIDESIKIIKNSKPCRKKQGFFIAIFLQTLCSFYKNVLKKDF